ncbi:hypothetical protein OHB04_08255 [Streptomyces sp. NBC_01775]|uniref:PASTA domain-containing protein n=1 Tax=Streptomyces sp. NBC_01775 TaxID=2975939 RepID=UPI002DDC2B79|nr:PASTA domain-containing protein [Streptomyces sp. NBC_01775]WSB75780.1 hypothetical protein OHB04_08255 [Streptomyces sp. NBC_01775]
MNQHPQHPYQQFQPPPQPPRRKHTGLKVTAAVFGVLVVIGGIASAVGEGDGSPKADKKPAASAKQKAKPEKPAADEKKETKKLPALTRKGLQSAQDEAQAAGFYTLTSHDALGRDRMQVFDRSWKVCSQKPAPGTHATDTEIDLGAVKTTEDCPAKDAGPVKTADGTMPNFMGKSVKAARSALDSSVSLDATDSTGQGRIVLMESNWEVCSQTPAAGTKLDGQPVTFKAVKFEENCA